MDKFVRRVAKEEKTNLLKEVFAEEERKRKEREERESQERLELVEKRLEERRIALDHQAKLEKRSPDPNSSSSSSLLLDANGVAHSPYFPSGSSLLPPSNILRAKPSRFSPKRSSSFHNSHPEPTIPLKRTREQAELGTETEPKAYSSSAPPPGTIDFESFAFKRQKTEPSFSQQPSAPAEVPARRTVVGFERDQIMAHAAKPTGGYGRFSGNKEKRDTWANSSNYSSSSSSPSSSSFASSYTLKPLPPTEEEIKARLNDEQRVVLHLAERGYSFFFTGSAGTGKSFVLRAMVDLLNLKHDSSSVFVTASTGMAACNIQGVTLHSFASIGLGTDPAEKLVDKIKKNQHSRNKWRSVRVLIIDEISMIGSDLFEKIEYIARRVRKDERPFGGIQVIVCGDFFQLPPVSKDSAISFCFNCPAWRNTIQCTVVLKEVIRQRTDPGFIDLLNALRRGEITAVHNQLLESRLNANVTTGDGIQPTRLYPFRKEVAQENMLQLNKIPGKVHVYTAVDAGEPYYRDQLLNNSPAPTILELKVNAQVMLLKNLSFEDQLVNGSRGVIIGFSERRERQEDGKGTKVPLSVEKDLNRANESDDLDVDDDGRLTSRTYSYPIVKFACGEVREILPDCWQTVLGNDVKATRYQVPLSLAYAISIHKSQGMTLDLVELALDNVFESGQAYVALSRVTALSGLKLLSYNASKIRAHPVAVQFYDTLQSIDKNNFADFIARTPSQRPSFAPPTPQQRKQATETLRSEFDKRKNSHLPPLSDQPKPQPHQLSTFGQLANTGTPGLLVPIQPIPKPVLQKRVPAPLIVQNPQAGKVLINPPQSSSSSSESNQPTQRKPAPTVVTPVWDNKNGARGTGNVYVSSLPSRSQQFPLRDLRGLVNPKPMILPPFGLSRPTPPSPRSIASSLSSQSSSLKASLSPPEAIDLD